MPRSTARAAAVALLAGLTLVPAAAAEPEPVTSFNLVTSDIAIVAAGGEVVERRSCEWREPGAEDMQCIAFAGDPDTAIAAIRDAGGDRARIHVTSPEIELDGLTTITRRADGTWLFRGEGTAKGERFASGRVCTADGERCSRYEAKGRKAAKQIRAAAARLRAKR